MDAFQAHKASIEALKRELRSVETASSAVTTATSGPAMASRAIMGRTSVFSRGLILEGSGQPHPPPSISPSDEAAARLADASGSASFGDLRSAILASTGNTIGESPNQRKSASKITKDKEGNGAIEVRVILKNGYAIQRAIRGNA